MSAGHSLTVSYDSVGQVVTVTIPGRTFAHAIAATPTDFETVAETVADAATLVRAFGESDNGRWRGLDGARAQLAEEISGGDPEVKGPEVTLDTTPTIDLVMQLLTVLADRSLVHDTAAIRAAYGIVGRVRNDEQIAELKHRKALAAAAATPKAAA